MRASELSRGSGYGMVFPNDATAFSGKSGKVRSYDITRFLVLGSIFESVCTVRLGRAGRIPVVKADL